VSVVSWSKRCLFKKNGMGYVHFIAGDNQFMIVKKAAEAPVVGAN
jgi:hypothetical protein